MAWFGRNSAAKKVGGAKKGSRTRRSPSKGAPSSGTGGKGGGGILTSAQRSEMVALGLIAVALFLLLSLVPLFLFGEWSEVWFPSGKAMGGVGVTVKAFLVTGAGLAAVCIPLLVLLAGLRIGGWISEGRSIRFALLAGGILLLLPPFLAVTGVEPEYAGWLGEALGWPLIAVFGAFGSFLLLGLAFVVLSIGTLEWNPLRPLARLALRGVKASWEGLLGFAERLRGSYGEWRAERAALATAASVPADRSEASEYSADGGDPFLDPFAPSAVDEELSAVSAPEGEPSGTAAAGAPAGAKGRSRTRSGPAQEELFPDPAHPRDLEGGELPPLDLLSIHDQRDRTSMDRELEALGEVLVEKLRTFNVESHIGGRTTGPVVTQFEVVPAPGVKVNRIANLDADLALAMRAQTIRIVAPIPGKGAVGVEIPNPKPEVVHLHQILASSEYLSSRADLPLALGEDLRGKPYVADLAKMPHALIAGATGAGKSVCLNTIITSLVYRHTPETLRLLLIDPKMVELSTYGDLPHLRHPVVTDPKEAAGVLKWAVLEMERRYALLSENGVRSLKEFNQRVKEGAPIRRAFAKGAEGDPERWIYSDGILPFIVVVLDELADLMMTVQGEVEKPLTHLAQKARAIGIHLIVATQRPSVNVITGLIKANFPCRIAFRVASKVDSRTILDQNGADALLGNGDMLFLPPGQSEPIRVQGAYIPTEDTSRLMGWFREKAALRVAELEETAGGARRVEEDILDQVRSHEAEEASEAGFGEEGFGEWDDLFQTAAEICIQHDQGSTSLLQRKLRIGYGRAARIMDQLHDAGVLGAPDGSKPREVLMSANEVEAMFTPRGDGTEGARIG